VSGFGHLLIAASHKFEKVKVKIAKKPTRVLNHKKNMPTLVKQY
jgi:hypothetical protein